jgi:NAD(P)-dependent dehydrogenase (short-subunit alcohol dehydrogenase family)
MDGKVAFITGAARGQGRSHALRLAEEGAEIIAVDVCQQVDTVPYEMSTADDLAETAKLVEEFDRRIVARQADVRDLGQLEQVVQEGISEFGHIDVVCANAGIASRPPSTWMSRSGRTQSTST